MKRDPVCGMEVSGEDAGLRQLFQGGEYFFCSAHCLRTFQNNPAHFLEKEAGDQAWNKKKSIAYGTAWGGALIVVFLAIVTLANGSFASALEEFKKIWYWILLLSGGFGLQVALFVYLKNAVHGPMAGASAEVAASGTVSTGSMLACCSHALASLLPIIGVSAAAAFLTRFQVPLLLLGVFSNLTGLTIMLGLFQRHQLLAAGSFITRLNMRTIRRAVIGSGIIAIGCAIILAA